MARVQLSNVSKQVGQTHILNNINLSINKGEFVVIVGPSGCGKSTLLRLIAGLEELSTGEIRLNDECINHVPPAKRDMAMVFQQYALYPHMNVFDNMAYGLKLRKLPKPEIVKKVSRVAKLLHLTPYLERKPHALSGGQKQRVAMGRAIVRSPSVFLFDEPLSNLDAKLRAEMRLEIKRLHERFKTTSVYVTHDQTEAMTMADRIIVLNQGAVEQVGAPQELYQQPSSVFVAGFTGHYPINFIAGHYDISTKSIVTSQGVSFPEPEWLNPVEDKTKLLIGIRPEHVLVSDEHATDAIKVSIEFIEDMGADKFLQTRSSINGTPINLRVLADQQCSTGQLYVKLPKLKLHVFDKSTGKRIGEWRE